MSEAQVPGQTTRGVVIGIDHGVATVLIGDHQDEWDFPMQLLPAETTEDSILLLTGEGYGLEVIGLAPERVDSVQSRLNRGLNRRRMAQIA